MHARPVTGAMRRNPLHAPALATLVVLALAGCSHPQPASQPKVTSQGVTLTTDQRAHLTLATVARQDVHAITQAPGRVDFDATRATTVLAPFSGPVTRLLVAPGDRVHAGQPLAAVRSSDFADAVGTYRKAVVAANNARRVADMTDDLVKHEGVSPREAAQADSDAASAEADRAAALQALEALHVDKATLAAIRNGTTLPTEATIRAPIAGTVIERQIGPGQLLQAGDTSCFVLADLSHLWVMAQLSTEEVARVHVGDPAEVITPAGEAVKGTVTFVADEIDPNTGLTTARVTVDGAAGTLRKQMYVQVRIHARQGRPALLVPVGAVQRDEANLPFVFIALPDGSFTRRHVTLGEREGKHYVVPAGLKAGERVVADGGLFLQFMQSQ